MAIFGMATYAQQAERSLQDINEDNSWLKVGVLLGAPVGDVSNYSSLAFGVDIAAQFMRTNNYGIGIATGYTKYFKKDGVLPYQGLQDGFGAVPLGVMFRYYPQSEGLFVGTDVGYTFITGEDTGDGGLYFRPQLGYHNYDFNVFAFYNHVVRPATTIDVQSVGVAFTYNIRFK